MPSGVRAAYGRRLRRLRHPSHRLGGPRHDRVVDRCRLRMNRSRDSIGLCPTGEGHDQQRSTWKVNDAEQHVEVLRPRGFEFLRPPSHTCLLVNQESRRCIAKDSGRQLRHVQPRHVHVNHGKHIRRYERRDLLHPCIAGSNTRALSQRHEHHCGKSSHHEVSPLLQAVVGLGHSSRMARSAMPS